MKTILIITDNLHRVGQRWTWARAWEIFRDNLIPAK